MKKFFWTLLFFVIFSALSSPSALAVTNDTVKVGLRYGSGALAAANLENSTGSGYDFGWFDRERSFTAVGRTDARAITMTAAGSADDPVGLGSYHAQLDEYFTDFDQASAAAAEYGGYVAYIDGELTVRVGCYGSAAKAEGAGVPGTVERSGSTAVYVTETGSTDVLFEFDCAGVRSLGVLPDGQGKEAVTWFKGYQYPGGFEYARITGGNLNVINVVDLEAYVQGVIPYEMNGDWPEDALKAQAVCARTYVCSNAKHLSSYGFDVCATTDCQVYFGRGSGGAKPSAVSDRAVEETAGECLYDESGAIINAVYFSSDGGATEDAENVWSAVIPYLKGREDPYEALITIPNYAYTVTYTPSELTWILQNSGYSIGTVANVYVSEYTAMGNVLRVTFTDTSGKTLTLKGDKARMAFYSTTYGKNVKSLRFTIEGGSGGGGSCYVNDASTPLSSLDDAYVISGSGTVGRLSSSSWALSSSGKTELGGGGSAVSGERFTITGKGNGHNVGMSQYGAKAMAENGHAYQEILHFYYTDVTLQ